MTIGILAVQGAFIEHEKMLEKLGVDSIELRKSEDLNKEFDGIILPGGESTVQGKLLRELNMYDNLKAQILSGKPVLSTCAGMILLAEKLDDDNTTQLAFAFHPELNDDLRIHKAFIDLIPASIPEYYPSNTMPQIQFFHQVSVYIPVMVLLLL
jgi:glutamine amidotransferase PdxT